MGNNFARLLGPFQSCHSIRRYLWFPRRQTPRTIWSDKFVQFPILYLNLNFVARWLISWNLVLRRIASCWELQSGPCDSLTRTQRRVMCGIVVYPCVSSSLGEDCRIFRRQIPTKSIVINGCLVCLVCGFGWDGRSIHIEACFLEVALQHNRRQWLPSSISLPASYRTWQKQMHLH